MAAANPIPTPTASPTPNAIAVAPENQDLLLLLLLLAVAILTGSILPLVLGVAATETDGRGVTAEAAVGCDEVAGA